MIIRFLILTFLILASIGYSTSLKVISFNINYGNNKVIETYDFINSFNADVILIQESSYHFQRKCPKSFKESYPFSYFTTSRNLAGKFCIYSKYSIISHEYHKPKHGLFGFQTAKIQFNNQQISLLNLHLNPPRLPSTNTMKSALDSMMKNEKIQIKEIEHINSIISTDLPDIVVGDFNSFPSSFAYQHFIKNEFIDSMSTFDTSLNDQPTWKMNLRGYPVSFRIDYIFHNSKFKPTQSSVYDFKYSDHSLLFAELQLKNK